MNLHWKETDCLRRPRDARISLRTLLTLIMVIGLVMLLLDARARSLSTAANARLAELDSTEPPDRAAIQKVTQREPTSARELSGGMIEVYDFGGGVPGRTYVINIGYVTDADQQMRYHDHNFNAPSGERALEDLISAHAQRLSTPPVEEVVFADGEAEVGVNETYRGLQRGTKLVLSFDGQAQTFTGTVANTTQETIKKIAIAVRLDDGSQAGPIALGDLEPGSAFPIQLHVEGTGFDHWLAYVENELYPNESYDAVRNGAHVNLAYDAEAKAFKGTVRNTTGTAIPRVTITVKLSDGAKLGPAVVEGIQPESEQEIALPAHGDKFAGWSVSWK
jgi:hypothetical protein